MSNKILRDFFYGSLSPNKKRVNRDSEYGHTVVELADGEEALRGDTGGGGFIGNQ